MFVKGLAQAEVHQGITRDKGVVEIVQEVVAIAVGKTEAAAIDHPQVGVGLPFGQLVKQLGIQGVARTVLQTEVVAALKPDGFQGLRVAPEHLAIRDGILLVLVEGVQQLVAGR